MKKLNESFICIQCKKNIEPAEKTCRNHCPFCFTSLHVDGDIPGDRKTVCHGIMLPMNYEMKNGDVKILFQCTKCGKQHWNKRAIDDKVEGLSTYIEIYKNNFMLPPQ